MGCSLVKCIKHSEESKGPSAKLLEKSPEPSNEDLQNKLYIKLINHLPRYFFQSASENVLKMHAISPSPSKMRLQGSAADGFLINGRYKSDIDFLYSMNIFTPSLQFKKLISDCNSPAYVKIEVIPNISECKTDIEKEKLMSNVEHKDGRYILSIEHIKHGICDQISKRLRNSSAYYFIIKSRKHSCFRIQFKHEFSKVMKNHVTDQIVHLAEFSENILKTTDFKENIKKLFYTSSGNYLVNQTEWKKFKEKFKLNVLTEKKLSSNHYYIDNSSKNKTLQQEIVKVLSFYFEEIKDEMNELLKWNKWHRTCFNICEDCFYFLLLILINCGLHTIVEVIRDKIIFVEHQNIELEEKLNYYDTVYFTEEEITKIISIDFISILYEPITQEEKEIEKIFHEFLVKNSIEIKNKIDWAKGCSLEEFSFVRMEDLKDGISRNKLYWLSSMIKLLIKFLENYKYFWTCPFFHSIIHHHTIEIVPGLYFHDWPLIASDWIRRKRYWPEPEIIQRIINNGYHVVFKSFNENDGYDGRLSFSEAETIMCHAMTRDQIIVYNLIKCQFRATESKNFKSYYIKTICFWVFELTPIDDNSNNIQAKYLQDIIKIFCTAVKERTLQHYFLPQHNLFIELKNEEFDEINECLWKIHLGMYKFAFEFMVTSSINHDSNVIHFFKLVENLFFKSIDETFKNIITDLIK